MGCVCRGAQRHTLSPIAPRSQPCPSHASFTAGWWPRMPGSGQRSSSTFNSDVPQQGVRRRFSHFKYFASAGRKQGSRKHGFVYPNTVQIKAQWCFCSKDPRIRVKQALLPFAVFSRPGGSQETCLCLHQTVLTGGERIRRRCPTASSVVPSPQ